MANAVGKIRMAIALICLIALYCLLVFVEFAFIIVAHPSIAL
jgi:hypothetical protein